MWCEGCKALVSHRSVIIIFKYLYDSIYSFDGELLELDDTPKNQDMEGNEIIDFKMK